MRIILDTTKRTVTVPWNYQKKLNELNEIVAQGGGSKQYDFKGYIDDIWRECMENSDKQLLTGKEPTKK